MEEAWSAYTGVENFSRRDDVHRVRVAPHVTYIPREAFRGCRGLREVDLANVTEIGGYAFYGCRELKEIDLSNVTEIGDAAFQSCSTGLRKITLRHVTTIGPGAFDCCKRLRAVELPEGLRTISQGAFHRCTGLKRVAIPSSVTEIGKSAFESCTELREVTKLEAVTLCEGLRVIGQDAFKACVKLESVVISSTVTEIRDGAFRYCTKLASVEILGGVQTIGRNAFDRCLLERITIPSPALVISEGDGNSLRCQLWREATIPPRDVRMVVSRHVKYLSPDCLEEAGRKIDETLGRNEEEGQWHARIRKLFAYYELLDATTMLELAIWKAKLDQCMQIAHDGVAEREQRRARVDTSLERKQCHRNSGAHIILPLVLPYIM